MSGGHWEYIQYRFTDIVEDIDKEIVRSGQPKTLQEMKEDWRDFEWYEKYPEDKLHYKYPEVVLEEFKKAKKIIQMSQIYIQRIDWLLSGDDGEESFISRLKEDLKKLEDEGKN